MKINIYNEKWQIKIVSQDKLRQLHGDDNQQYFYQGSCDRYNSIIYLLDELKKQRQRAILIHEIAHAINGIIQGDDVDITEEQLVSFVAGHYDEIGNVLKQFYKKEK